MGSITAHDVAAAAGVSRGTVSNYLNHPERVSPEARERISEAIETLGYIPNQAGRMLRLGSSAVIGYIVPDLANPFLASVAAGAEEGARERGLSVLLANSDGDPRRELDYIDMFEALRVRGLLISSVGDPAARLSQLRRSGVPSVLVGAESRTADQPSVAVDNVLGGKLAVDHLLAVGCSRITFVGGPPTRQQVADRLTGAMSAVGSTGASLDVRPTADNTIAEGRRIAAILDDLNDYRPDGVFAANDLVALGIIEELRRRGVTSIPDDVAVVGYDDIDYAASAGVPLTSVRAPHETLGRAALELLLREIDGRVDGAAQVVFAPELVQRASTHRFVVRGSNREDTAR